VDTEESGEDKLDRSCANEEMSEIVKEKRQLINPVHQNCFEQVMSLIKYCQEMFHFEPPSITLQSRSEKFEMNIAMLRLC